MEIESSSHIKEDKLKKLLFGNKSKTSNSDKNIIEALEKQTIEDEKKATTDNKHNEIENIPIKKEEFVSFDSKSNHFNMENNEEKKNINNLLLSFDEKFSFAEKSNYGSDKQKKDLENSNHEIYNEMNENKENSLYVKKRLKLTNKIRKNDSFTDQFKQEEGEISERTHRDFKIKNIFEDNNFEEIEIDHESLTDREKITPDNQYLQIIEYKLIKNKSDESKKESDTLQFNENTLNTQNTSSKNQTLSSSSRKNENNKDQSIQNFEENTLKSNTNYSINQNENRKIHYTITKKNENKIPINKPSKNKISMNKIVIPSKIADLKSEIKNKKAINNNGVKSMNKISSMKKINKEDKESSLLQKPNKISHQKSSSVLPKKDFVTLETIDNNNISKDKSLKSSINSKKKGDLAVKESYNKYEILQSELNKYKEKSLKGGENVKKANKIIEKLQNEIKIKEIENEVKIGKALSAHIDTIKIDSKHNFYKKEKGINQLKPFLNISHPETFDIFQKIISKEEKINNNSLSTISNIVEKNNDLRNILSIYGILINKLVLKNLNSKEEDLNLIQTQQDLIENLEIQLKKSDNNKSITEQLHSESVSLVDDVFDDNCI